MSTALSTSAFMSVTKADVSGRQELHAAQRVHRFKGFTFRVLFSRTKFRARNADYVEVRVC